jgi:hypothetical protein
MDSKGKRPARGAAAAGGDKPRWKTAGKKGPSDGTAPPKGKGKPKLKEEQGTPSRGLMAALKAETLRLSVKAKKA